MSEEVRYKSQKEYLSKKKQLRVWLDADKYELLKVTAKANGESVYSIINNFVDAYLQKNN